MAKDHFEELTLNVYEDIKLMLELKTDGNQSIAPEPMFPVAFRSVKNVYRSCMGQTLPDATPLEWFFQNIKTMGPWPLLDDSEWEDSQFDLTSLLGAVLRMKGESALFKIQINASDMHPEHAKLRIEPALDGLGFGEKSAEIYTSTDAYSQLKITHYKEHLHMMARHLKDDLNPSDDDDNDASPSDDEKEAIDSDVAGILELEKTIARLFSMDVGNTLHSRYLHPRLNDMNRLVPVIEWERLLLMIVPASMHSYIRSNPYIIIEKPGLLSELSALIARSSPRIIANFVIAQYASERSHMLGDRYQSSHRVPDKDFNFGTASMPDYSGRKWLYCVLLTMKKMPHAVSAMYGRDNHPKELISLVTQIVEDVKAAYVDMLNESESIDDDMRNEALKKLKYLKTKIGYPEFIFNDERLDEYYKGTNIDSSMNFPQIQEILHRWSYTTDLEWLIQTRDRGIWWEDPLTVNAYYAPELNAISILAGILGKPFIFSDAPASYNYATIGEIIGHEIGHAFDSNGWTYDHVGRKKAEFNNATKEMLQKKYDCIISQYENIEISDAQSLVNGTKLDGNKTLGENIADNDGLKAAFRAYKKFLARTGGKDMQVGNRTHEQMFFVGYALHSCEVKSVFELEYQIIRDSHAPAFARVNIPLQNFDEFSKAFNCPIGSPMNPEKKCYMWGGPLKKKEKY